MSQMAIRNLANQMVSHSFQSREERDDALKRQPSCDLEAERQSQIPAMMNVLVTASRGLCNLIVFFSVDFNFGDTYEVTCIEAVSNPGSRDLSRRAVPGPRR